MKGIVKWYNKEKGFGFIGTEDGDYFVHHSFVEGTINEGDKVIFEIKKNKRGNIASNVKKERN